METREMSIEMMSGPSIIYRNLMLLTTSPRDVFRIILCCLWSLILIDLVRRSICFLSFIHGSLLIFSSNEYLILSYTFLISDGQRRSLVARPQSLESVLLMGFSSHQRCGYERDLSEIMRCRNGPKIGGSSCVIAKGQALLPTYVRFLEIDGKSLER